MKPRIGVTVHCVGDDSKIYSVRNSVVGAVADHGGIPVGLFQTKDSDSIRAAVNLVDGLLIPGGIDVSPISYGEEAVKEVTYICRELDIFETELIKEAVKQKKPVFGICRGMQIINVALGGTLIQDISDKTALCHCQDKGISTETIHKVYTESGSMMRRFFGDEIPVNSYHHQAIKATAENLKATAKASDGIIEALESPDGLICAVQWHPERLYQSSPVFSAFFKALIGRSV